MGNCNKKSHRYTQAILELLLCYKTHVEFHQAKNIDSFKEMFFHKFKKLKGFKNGIH